MIYLMLQMLGALLLAGLFGAVLLWLAQALWGTFLSPMRTRTLEYELDEAKSDLISQQQRLDALQRELATSKEDVDSLQRANRALR